LEPQEVRCYDHHAPTRKVIHLRESDPSPDDAPADLPLRDEVSAEPPLFPRESSLVSPPPRLMFGASDENHQTPARPAEAGHYEAPVRPADAGHYEPAARAAGGGVSMWLVAAASLVVGILIGFASGYTAAQPDQPSAAIVDADPPPVPEPAPVRDPASAGSTQTFTEDKVDRVDPEPIVPEAAPAPRAAAPVTAPPSTSRSAPPAARRTEPAPAPRAEAPAVERRTPPVNAAAAGDGSGSMEVVSRPAGAQVVLDGLVIGKTPMVLAAVPSGQHSVRIELPGFQRWATSVNVSAGQRTRVAASLEQ
jgi:hypothetical protein